ncbi:MAG: metallophosphatase, partial [Flintibacter sp.]|nr:metallophosphatase [Flintibacter sp.]
QRGALFRVNHRSWWAEELPSEAEYLEARANLARVHWNVDYIISHCCPSSIQDVFSGGMFKKGALTEFFDEVRQKCTFQYWFFGHYRSNMVIEKRYAMLYEQIIRLK